MKKIFTIGGIIVLGTAAALVATASVGDVVSVRGMSDPQLLNVTQKTALGDAANQTFAVPSSKLDFEFCWQNTQNRMKKPGVVVQWRCRGGAEVTLTDEQYVTADLAGELKDPEAETIVRRTPVVVLNASQKEAQEVVTQSVWSLPLDQIHAFEFKRDPDATANVYGKHAQIVTETPAEYRESRSSGLVLFPVGRIGQ